jgi:hypothetical protein
MVWFSSLLYCSQCSKSINENKNQRPKGKDVDLENPSQSPFTKGRGSPQIKNERPKCKDTGERSTMGVTYGSPEGG